MTVRDELLSMLEDVASALGDELDSLVLVGGSALALYPLRPGTVLRPTVDVDFVADADLAAYYRLQGRLGSLGFTPDPDGPICRMRKGPLTLDVMPAHDDVLGFTNRWYRRALVTATSLELPSGRRIRTASPPTLAATKCEAFLGRGGGDFFASHDIEDLIP